MHGDMRVDMRADMRADMWCSHFAFLESKALCKLVAGALVVTVGGRSSSAVVTGRAIVGSFETRQAVLCTLR